MNFKLGVAGNELKIHVINLDVNADNCLGMGVYVAKLM